jgi:hypothetical protein
MHVGDSGLERSGLDRTLLTLDNDLRRASAEADDSRFHDNVSETGAKLGWEMSGSGFSGTPNFRSLGAIVKQTRNDTKGEIADKSGALPRSVLMGLVGGTRIDNKHQVTPEAAAALTAGGHEPGASMGFGGFDPAKPSSSLPAAPATEPAKAKMEVAIASSNIHLGEHGAFTLKLDMHETKQAGSDGPAAKFELNATGIKGQPDSVKVSVINQDTKERTEYSAKDIDARAKAGDPLLKDVSETVKKIVAADPKHDGDLAKEIDKQFSGKVTKIGHHANTTVNPDYYKVEAKREGPGDWTTKTTSSDLDRQQADADKAIKQKADADLTDALRKVPGTVQDAANKVTAQKATQTEYNTSLLRENLAKQDLDAAASKLAEGEAAAKAGKANAPASDELKSLKDAKEQAAASHVKAKEVAADAKKNLDDRKAERVNAAEKVVDARKQVDAAKQALDKANGKAVDADKAAKEKQSAIGKFADSKAGKVIISKGSKILREAGDTAAKAVAKEHGAYHESKSRDVVAGGVDQTTVHDGNKAKTTTTIAQVVAESGTFAYAGPIGAGAGAEWGRKAEAGKEVSIKVDNGDGTSKTLTGAAYASASANSGAKASISLAGIDAQASVKLAADATASITEVKDYGVVKTTTKAEAAAHAEAGARAGATLGFDGVNIGAKASAEASVKAGASQSVSIGDAVDIAADVAVFAKAKAEAKADMNLSFFGKDGTKVKAGFGAEAAAGVGVEGGTGYKAAGGGGADVGAGIYVGKIGAKADADVGFKDGKFSADLNLGLAAGLGVNIHIKVSSNIGKALDEAVDHINNGNILEKAAGVIGIFACPIVGLFI